jgi:hypothetical protein
MLNTMRGGGGTIAAAAALLASCASSHAPERRSTIASALVVPAGPKAKKICQLIGDTDYETRAPTTNLTETNGNVVSAAPSRSGAASTSILATRGPA